MMEYKDVNYIEIVPLYDGYKFKINIVYEKKEPTIITENKTKKTSVDLGMKNIISSYDTKGNAELYKGNRIIAINEFANKKIGYWQRKLTETKDAYSKEKIQNIIYDSRIKRTNKLNNEFNLITKKFIEQNNSCSKIIFGYNKSWKQASDMTTDNNRKFQHIPYTKLLYKIHLKLKEQKIESITRNESYTSKCDALAYEEVNFQNEYKGKRFTRSLFKSQYNTENEKIIHSDINGAINIMRKEYPDMVINKRNIFNPVNLAWR
jgi:putative transposase